MKIRVYFTFFSPSLWLCLSTGDALGTKKKRGGERLRPIRLSVINLRETKCFGMNEKWNCKKGSTFRFKLTAKSPRRRIFLFFFYNHYLFVVWKCKQRHKWNYVFFNYIFPGFWLGSGWTSVYIYTRTYSTRVTAKFVTLVNKIWAISPTMPMRKNSTSSAQVYKRLTSNCTK